MNLVFDINEFNEMSVTITPDRNDDEEELHQLAHRLYINNPVRDILRRAKNGAFNHLPREQYDHYISQIKLFESFFANEIAPYQTYNPGTMHRINIFLFLERIIEKYLNLDDNDTIEEGGCEP